MILFKDIAVITMDDEKPLLKNANVFVKDGKISFEGDETKAEKIYDGRNKCLMPGLVNAHAHSSMTLLRGVASDMNLQDWLFNNIIPREQKFTKEHIVTGAMLAMAEMLSSGTVSFTDMYYKMDEIAKAIDEVGMKVNISNGIVSFDSEGFVYENSNEYRESFTVLQNFHTKKDGRIKVDASIHAEYTSAPYMWTQVLDFAKEHKLNIHLHLSETRFEHEECKKKYGMTPTQVFNKYGIFDVPVSAAHGVWIEECDMEILKGRATVVHNPVSNLKLASGIAPVTKMQSYGVNVALGTDGCASNNSNDMFEEMKLAGLLQKGTMYDATVLPSYEALKLATINGAKSQGRADCGAIKEGYCADLIMIDLDNERLMPCTDLVANIVYSATGRDVCLTMCNGQVLYENGEHKTIDMERLLSNVRRLMTV